MMLEFKEMEVACILGMLEHEQEIEQRVLVDVKIQLEPNAIPSSDDEVPLVDTRTINAVVRDTLREGKFKLQETAVQQLATNIMALRGVQGVWVRTSKPSAFPFGLARFQYQKGQF